MHGARQAVRAVGTSGASLTWTPEVVQEAVLECSIAPDRTVPRGGSRAHCQLGWTLLEMSCLLARTVCRYSFGVCRRPSLRGARFCNPHHTECTLDIFKSMLVRVLRAVEPGVVTPILYHHAVKVGSQVLHKTTRTYVVATVRIDGVMVVAKAI